ncbi:MAG: hypothetical protein HUU29_10855 [Planctomycetaceae bacterium]|nr:hypothetical protein [Planctomycetaceae bacterium]
MADPACSTAEDREALFTYLCEKTLAREAFSAIKYEKLKMDPKQAMLALREEFVAADTEERLFYALCAMSNTRKDRHLRVSLIDGGLKLSHTAGVDKGVWPMSRDDIAEAPIRFANDYGQEDHYFLFVADYARNIEQLSGGVLPDIGDRVTDVGGVSFAEYVQRVEPYQRYSTHQGLWFALAQGLGLRSYHVPPWIVGEQLELELERRSGGRYRLTLPYLPHGTIEWNDPAPRAYSGFTQIFKRDTFDLYQHAKHAVLLIDWHLFGSKLLDDVDEMMALAKAQNMLDHALIFDGTQGGGGARGVYLMQRLVSQSFTPTFGNLRISDVTEAFIEQRRAMHEHGKVNASGIPETMDGGKWQMDWFLTDVRAAIRAGEAYTKNVPFKLAHAPKASNNLFQPAEVHFRGPMAVLLGPHGGSHLDQFASIVADNNLAHTIGMPTGGFSSTWEWEEDLRFPISKRPLVRYRWSMGRSIRPNGEVLEGNPAMPKEYLPQTRDNYLGYHRLLIDKALRHFGKT